METGKNKPGGHRAVYQESCPEITHLSFCCNATGCVRKQEKINALTLPVHT